MRRASPLTCQDTRIRSPWSPSSREQARGENACEATAVQERVSKSQQKNAAASSRAAHRRELCHIQACIAARGWRRTAAMSS